MWEPTQDVEKLEGVENWRFWWKYPVEEAEKVLSGVEEAEKGLSGVTDRSGKE